MLTTEIYFPSKGWQKQRKTGCIVYRGEKKKRYQYEHWCELTQIQQGLARCTPRVSSQAWMLAQTLAKLGLLLLCQQCHSDARNNIGGTVTCFRGREMEN